MRVLHYSGMYAPAWSLGGPPRSVSKLCEGLAALGHEVTVLTTNIGLHDRSDIPTDRPVERNGVEVHYFPAIANWRGLQSPALEANVRARVKDFDLLHLTGVWQPTSRAACQAARLAGKPYVYSPRGGLGGYAFMQKPVKKWIYYRLWERSNLDHAAAIHLTSNMEREEYMGLALRPPGFVMPNSVDLESWQRDEPGARDWRLSHGIGEKEFVMLFTGRLHHKKGLDLLLPVCAGLPKELAWRLVLVGFDEDGTGARLRHEFSRAGLSERLMLVPGVESDQLASIYSAADQFVFPSRHENFGNAVIEALACGCLVMASDQVGVADQVADMPGVVVLPAHPGKWISSLSQRISGQRSPVDRKVMRDQVMKRFSPEILAAKMASEYLRILEGNR